MDKVYQDFLSNLKSRVLQSQRRMALSANSEILFLYWEIGGYILEKQAELGWGAKVISQLSKDLTESFADIRGFSVRNLNYMRKFATSYPPEHLLQLVDGPADAKVQHPAAQLGSGEDEETDTKDIEGDLTKVQHSAAKIENPPNLKDQLPSAEELSQFLNRTDIENKSKSNDG